MTEDILRCSVSDLLSIFRDALEALLPTADRLLLQRADDHQHHDWENLAEAVFNTCVRGPIQADSARRDKEFPLPRYDIDVDTYANSSWIAAVNGAVDQQGVLIRLLSGVEPFDCVQVAILDPDTLNPTDRVLLPFAGTEFVYIRRSAAQPDVEIHSIQAID